MILGNSKIRFLYNDVINIFNQSDISIEVKRLIAECVFHQIEKQADRAINEELNPPKDSTIVYGEENEDGDIVLREESNGSTESI